MSDPAAPQDVIRLLLGCVLQCGRYSTPRQELLAALGFGEGAASETEIDERLRAALLPREKPEVVRPVQGAPSEEAITRAVMAHEAFGVALSDSGLREKVKQTIEAYLTIDARSSSGRDGCPCLIVEPCSNRCTCRWPHHSGGCRRCATYGSDEQRLAAATRLASLSSPPAKEEGLELEEAQRLIADTLEIPHYAYGDNEAACRAFSVLRELRALLSPSPEGTEGKG